MPASASTTTRPSPPNRRREDTRRGRPKGEPQTFDFRRPSTLSREHVRTMQIVQETLARGITTTLASSLRAVAQVSITNIEQRPYDEYIQALPNPTLLAMVTMKPLSGVSLLQVPLEVAYAITELMMGGNGSGNQPRRAMSDLELTLIRGVLEQTLPEWRVAFEPIANIDAVIAGLESNPQFAQIAAPTDMMVIVSFELKIEGVTGEMTLCMPFSGLQPHLEALTNANRMGDDSSEKMRKLREQLTATINEAGVSAAAVFRPAVANSSQMMHLAVGDVLVLNHPTGMPLTLETGGVPIFDVTIGRVNRQLGLQVVGRVPQERRRRKTRLHLLPGPNHDESKTHPAPTPGVAPSDVDAAPAAPAAST